MLSRGRRLAPSRRLSAGAAGGTDVPETTTERSEHAEEKGYTHSRVALVVACGPPALGPPALGAPGGETVLTTTRRRRLGVPGAMLWRRTGLADTMGEIRRRMVSRTVNMLATMGRALAEGAVDAEAAYESAALRTDVLLNAAFHQGRLRSARLSRSVASTTSNSCRGRRRAAPGPPYYCPVCYTGYSAASCAWNLPSGR